MKVARAAIPVFVTMHMLFISALIGDAEAQSVSVKTTDYPLVDYEDSNGASADEAIAAGVVDEYDTKSFKIKILSKKKSFYTDSRGARLWCKERRNATICAASFPADGTACTTTYTYSFGIIIKKKRLVAVFEELFSCPDGSYIYFRHSGTTRFTIKRR